MDNEQAKFVLRAYRPSGKDAETPEMSEALERARQDPVLGRWLEEETEFDRAMIEKIREVKPPADLRESILAGAKVARPARFDWRPALLAVAACVALLVAVLLNRPVTAPDQVAAAEAFAVDYLEKLTRLDHKSASLAEVRAWIGERRPNRVIEVPPGLADVPTLGCRLADWDGREFSLVCFKSAGEGLRPEAHLFVFKREDLPLLPVRGKVRLVQRGDWAVAGWVAGESSYLLARVGDADSLRNLL